MTKLLGPYPVPNCILIFDVLRMYEELVLILGLIITFWHVLWHVNCGLQDILEPFL